MICRRLSIIVFVLCALCRLAPAEEHFPIDFPMEGPKSRYTDIVADMARRWPPGTINYSVADPAPVHVNRIDTPENELYIGAEQWMDIEAPIQQVQAVIEDFESYIKLFPEFADVHVVERDANRLTVHWEHRIPLFFVPNEQYDTLYLLDFASPTKKICRYKLRAVTSHMKTADGLIVLESLGPKKTRYTEYDFWDSDYGILGSLAPRSIWEDSLKELYRGDVAIKLRAEHPDWNSDRLTDAVTNAGKDFDIEKVLKAHKMLELTPAVRNLTADPVASKASATPAAKSEK